MYSEDEFILEVNDAFRSEELLRLLLSFSDTLTRSEVRNVLL
jgi:hypothetical protein